MFTEDLLNLREFAGWGPVCAKQGTAGEKRFSAVVPLALKFRSQS
jgi:hypothetical protein